jgi:hypothetical protein
MSLNLRAVLCCIFLLALTACGGRASLAGTPVQLTPTPPGMTTTPASLPALPADELLNPRRMTAAVDATQNGAGFVQKSGNAVLSGNSLQLASGASQVAWGLYLFGGAPGEQITDLSYALSGLDAGEKVYCAVGDFSSGRWSYLPLSGQASATFTLPSGNPSPVQSPLGNSWILLATFGGDDVTVDSLKLTYPNRHNVTGQVLDMLGNGIDGVRVSTSFAGVAAVTAADGTYTLEGMPDGTWPLLAARDGFAFYSQPSYVTLAGADAVAPDLLGNPHGSRFDNYDYLPNNNINGAPFYDLENDVLNESLSADDDQFDCYRFTVTANGSYRLQFSNPDLGIKSPYLNLVDGAGNTIGNSVNILDGEVGVGFTVNTAPQDFVCSLNCQGGGGKYQLRLQSGVSSRLLLKLDSMGTPLNTGLVSVANDDSGLTTRYFVSMYVPSPFSFAVYDPSYPLGSIHATPSLGAYVFNPMVADLTVSAGTLATQTFTTAPPVLTDSFEPNDFDSQAHAITLPYSSALGPDPLKLTATSPIGDTTDFFTCTPPMGSAIGAYVSAPGIEPGQPLFSLTVYSDVFDQLSTMTVLNGVVAALPTALTNGNKIYIVVQPADSKNQTLAYGLSVQAIPNPVKFQLAARVTGGDLLPGAKFLLFDPTFYRFTPLTAGNDGLTPPLYLTGGFEIRAECYRYGTAHERQTLLYNVPPSDSVLYFDAPDLGNDALEPNNDGSLAYPEQALPATIDATIGQASDNGDYYQLAPGDGKPFKVSLSEAGGCEVSITMYDHNNSYVADATVADGGTAYLPNDGMSGQKIFVGMYEDRETHYQLDITTADAYRITGTVKDVATNPLDAQVVVVETGDHATSASWDAGKYQFYGLYPPGNYTIAAFMPNYDPGANTQPVTITNADAVVDFSNLMPVNHDDFEPNDDEITATPAVLATNYVCAVGSTTDYADYFKVALAAGDRVRFKVTPQDPWMTTSTGILDAYTSFGVYGTHQPDGSTVIDYTVPENDDYVFYVTGQAHYTFRVDKLN